MAISDYPTLVARQREYFLAGQTRPAAWRRSQLEAVKALFTENHDELCDALWKDLRRNVIDADLMDVTYCAKEADYALRHLEIWMEPRRAPMPLVFQPGHIRVRRDPLGVTLIIGAWNEPFMLTFGPLTAALAGGNTTVLKPSEVAANLKVAARRIAYGRFSNSGHICTAPDHVLIWPEVKEEFVRHLSETIREFYGDDPKTSPDYGRVINRRNFDRLVGLMGSGKIVVGGKSDPAELYIAPTVLMDVSPDSPIMQEEVFGPILPVLEIESVEAVIKWVNDRPSPLGLYVFAEDSDVVERILDATSSGDAEVNDCAIHPLFPELPFGGVGNSGMGKYHGHWGFEAFTNARGVLYHSAKLDPGVRYPPYTKHTLQRAITSKLMP